MNINEAAEALGVSTRTIRRYIKSGRIQAELITGQFGQEYRILELPSDLSPAEETPESDESEKVLSQMANYDPGEALVQSISLLRELQEKNVSMAAQLGIATERIRNLESQIEQLKLLTTPKIPWWKKPFVSEKKAK
ncbi:MAG: helix-turn-helix domain-containing protein [Dehalococcoidales bacterium]